MEATTVGVIGSGNVGKALARGFASRGHDVMIGSRSPDKPELREWLDGEGVSAVTFDEVAPHGEITVLATPGAAVDEAIAQAGPDNLAGKVLIDATNRHSTSAESTPRASSSRSACCGSRPGCAAAPSITPSSC